jgi:hypothetical protein
LMTILTKMKTKVNLETCHKSSLLLYVSTTTHIN